MTKSQLYDSLCRDIAPPDEEQKEAMRERFSERGFSAAEVDRQIEREQYRTEQLLEHGRTYHMVLPPVMMFSYGRVQKGA